jgi:hypothetical protein
LTDHCTVLGGTTGYAAILAAVRGAAPPATVVVVGSPNAWTVLSVQSVSSSLRLTTMRRVRPGDEFSKLVLGLHNHFRKAAEREGQAGRLALNRVAGLQLAVGVVAEPAIDHEEWMERVILSTAQAMEGLIFNGHALLASDGTLVLDSQGTR